MRSLLLSGTAVSLGAAFALAGAPAAQAACIAAGANPVVITCDDTTTQNNTNPPNNLDARNQVFNDNLEGIVQPGATVDGYGLRLQTTLANGTIDMDHQGTLVELSQAGAGTGSILFGPGALELNGNGGLIQYTGDGAVSNLTTDGAGVLITNNGAGGVEFGTAATPVVPDYTGPTALSIHTESGDQNIFLDGGTVVVTDPLGDGVFATSTTGDINIELTGNTAITTTAASPNNVFGVRTQSAGGSVTIASDADIGTAGFEFVIGLNSFSSDGSAVDITQTGGTIMATGEGIFAVTSGANAGISVTTDALSLIDMIGGTGIFATQLGTSGGVIVTVNGDIEGADDGVIAQITDATNADDVGVTASSSVEALTGNSIRATTAGTGDAGVVLLDGATLQGGVLAQSQTGNANITAGNNVTVIGNSPGAASITAGGNATQVWGDNATVTGSSGIVVDQTSPAGAGVATVVVGNDGEIIGDGTDLTDDYNGNGIFAGNQGTGLTSVTTGTGTSVTGAANGIVAFQTNAANTSDMTITTDGPVTGNGTVAFVLAPYTDAFVAAVLPTTGLGIGVSNEGTGDISVSAGGTVSGATVGIQTLAAGGGDIAITTGGAVTGGLHGIYAAVTGAGEIAILANGAVTGTAGDGILTSAVDGVTAILTNAAVTGGIDGIDATATGAGAISIQTNGTVSGTAGDGIVTSAVDGGTAIQTNAAVTGGIDGIDASATGAGAISILANGAVTGTTGDGIVTSTAGGATAIQTNAAVTGGIDGIDATVTGAGAISIQTNGTVEGTAGDGIVTSTAGGATAILTNAAVTGGIDGIDATTTGAGAISMQTNGTVTGTAGDGIVTSAVDGATAIQTNAAVTGGIDGIDASATGAGSIAILASGTVDGAAGDGIVTAAVVGDTAIAANGDVTGADDGIDASATGAGDIDVDVGLGATVTGTTGAGVATSTATGTATIDNFGLIQGFVTGISGATATVLNIVNHAGGVIQNLSGEIGDLAISVTGAGVTDIDNEAGGTIAGRIATGGGSDIFTNSGLWRTTGVSDFGAGNDAVTNSGRITVAEEAAVAEITHFANLESFINASTGLGQGIDMVDDNAPNVSDQLTIDGLYTGLPGSKIEMDLALVAGDPQAGSDRLILDPAVPATGTTDFLFNIVSTGQTATTQNAGRVGFAGGQLLAAPVTVVENRGTLTTSSGDDDIPLARSGLINYDLVSTAPAGGDFQVVSELDPSLAGGILLPVPATLAAVAFTTQRTPNPLTATCIDPDNKPNAQGGWARGFAGEFDTETQGEAAVDGSVSDLESNNTTRFRTLQGGFDHVICNLDPHGSTLHLGVTVGQTWGESRQDDPDPLAGIFGTDIDFDTFFVGPYAAFTRGNFAMQAALRFDFHSLELSNPTLEVDAIDVDANGVSGSTSMSYDYTLGDLTITPDVGVNVSTTEIDRFDIAGGTVVLDDLWSVIGHAGVTARTTLAIADNVFVIPFAAATLYHEFVESADGKLILGATTAEVEANRVGTFGQLGIGANAVRLGDVVAGRPTLFGGARFDLQMGERIEGATATVFGRVQF